MSPDSPPAKTFAVVLRLDIIPQVNGTPALDAGRTEDAAYVEEHFRNRYGDGTGRLKVQSRPNKVKLAWEMPGGVSEEAEEVHQKALAAAKNRQYQEAIGSWVRAIALNPHDPDYYFNLGIAFFEVKNYKEATENLHEALRLCPIYYKAHLILGTVYLKTRKFEQAEKYLRESLVFYPTHPLAYLNLGAVYSILKRYQEGEEMFLRTIGLAPNEVRAHFGIAKIYSLTGDTEKAARYFQNVININTNPQLTNIAKRSMPTTVMASTASGETKSYAGAGNHSYADGYAAFLFSDYSRAVAAYESYLSEKPDDDYAWYSLGEACLRSGAPEKAAEAFQKAVALNSAKGTYYKSLAITYNYLSNTKESIACLEKAASLGKTDSVTLTVWGKVLLDQQNFEEATKKLELAVKANPNNLLARYNLAIAAYRSQNRDAALNQLHEIMHAPISSPLKMEAEKLIQEI